MLQPARPPGLSVFLWLLAACTESSTPSDPVTLVDVSIPNPALSPGDFAQFNVGVFGTTGRLTDRSVAWFSTNPSAATVSDSGLVTGIALGITYIKATSDGVSDSVRFRVVNSFAEVQAGEALNCAYKRGAALYCWGYLGSFGIGRDTAVPIAQLGGFSTISLTRSGGCGLTSLGDAYCWGFHPSGLGGQPTPVQVPKSVTWKSIGVSENLVCGLGTDSLAYCWGQGQSGQAITDTVRFTSIAVGYNHLCGIGADGSTFCWGYNQFGQLGVPIDPFTPLFVRLQTPTPFVAIYAGDYHTCAAGSSGHAYCWGDNGSGQLGSRTATGPAIRPVAGGQTWSMLAAGGSQTCGISTAGETWCWGNLGVRLRANVFSSNEPYLITSTHNFDQLAAGGSVACGHTGGGGVYCWGNGFNGLLGNGAGFSSLVPQRVIDP